nr:hypothetical protein CFP56_14702 [Quercus suber]
MATLKSPWFPMECLMKFNLVGKVEREDRALQSRLRFSTIDKSEDRTSNIGNLYSCFAIPSLIVQQSRLCCSTTENS